MFVYSQLASDFKKIYPEAEGKFENGFLKVKGRLLSLLDEKAQQLTRADNSIQTVLDLATCEYLKLLFIQNYTETFHCYSYFKRIRMYTLLQKN